MTTVVTDKGDVFSVESIPPDEGRVVDINPETTAAWKAAVAEIGRDLVGE